MKLFLMLFFDLFAKRDDGVHVSLKFQEQRMYVLRLRAHEEHHISSRSPSRQRSEETETRELLGGTEEISFSPRVHRFALPANQNF